MRSIRTKLLLVFSLIIILGLSILGILTYLNLSKSLERIISDSSLSLLENQSKQIENYFNGLIHQIILVSNENIFKDLDFEDSIKILKKDLENLNDFSMLFIADKNGDAYTTSNVKTNIKDREYFKEIMSGSDLAISDVLISKADGSSIIVIAYAIKNNNKTIGLIGATISLNKFLDFIVADSEKGMEGFLVDSYGKIISHNKKEYIGSNIDSLNYIGLDKIKIEMLNGKSGYNTVIDNSEEKILFYYPIRNLEWSAALLIPKKVMLQSVEKVINTFLVVILITLVVVLIIT
ncbi:cache domain-containing protein, partial [Marinitoga arctica]